MTVRLTQSRSGYPRRSRQPFPTGAGHPPGEEDPARGDGTPPDGSVSGAVTARPEPAGSGSRLADRQAVRAARRTRRNLAILCGLVVAVCLVLTILIVDMARTRTTGGQSSLSLPALSGTHVLSSSPAPTLETRDAPASERGAAFPARSERAPAT